MEAICTAYMTALIPITWFILTFYQVVRKKSVDNLSVLRLHPAQLRFYCRHSARHWITTESSAFVRFCWQTTSTVATELCYGAGENETNKKLFETDFVSRAFSFEWYRAQAGAFRVNGNGSWRKFVSVSWHRSDGNGQFLECLENVFFIWKYCSAFLGRL